MGSRNVVIGLVASVLTVAAAVGLLLLVEPAGGRDVDLPDRIGSLEAVTEPASVTDRLAYSSEQWARAFDADADSALYRDGDGATDTQVSVTAVAEGSGPLVPEQGFVDGPSLGFALPRVERVVRGDVQCLLFRSLPPRLGTAYEPAEAEPDSVLCQRTTSDLTVRVSSSGDLDTTVDQVDVVWDELD